MSTSSGQFIAFVVITAILVQLSTAKGWRSTIMLVANIAFMACFAMASPFALLPVAAFLLLGFAAVRLLQSGRPRLLWPLVAATLAGFFWLKRYNFVPEALWLESPYVTIGLSYIFFRVLHLVIDAGQGVLPERLGLLDYFNYALNFPCIVAGPIQMYPDFRAGAEGRPDKERLAWATRRILTGLFKVVIVSAFLDAAQQQLRTALLAGDGAPALLAAGVVAIFPVYLYFNFSGYTDIVVGAARLTGLRLPENFNRPFSAPNFIDFWSRWHITLSTWLRTYVFSPLLMLLLRRLPAGGAAGLLTSLCFFVTFFLVGAWHGQTSEFLFFGILQGGGVCANKLWQVGMVARLGRKPYKALGENPLYRALCRGLTFSWFGFTLLWFWSSWHDIAAYAHAAGLAGSATALLAIWAAASLVLAALCRAQAAWDAYWAGGRGAFRWPDFQVAQAGAMAFLLVSLTVLVSAPPPPIVYKQF